MSKKINLIGQKFGRLTVIEEAGRKNGHRMWLCNCECGKALNVPSHSLTSGNTKSCGCFNIDTIINRNLKHGMSKHPLYEKWIKICSRCNKLTDTRYQYYGGRGISVCERWSYFPNFAKDMGLPPSPTHSIDRIDNDGNYEPTNCQWATHKTQCRNRRSNKYITIDGIRKLQVEWCAFYNIPHGRYMNRLRRGWSVKKALTSPPLNGQGQPIIQATQK